MYLIELAKNITTNKDIPLDVRTRVLELAVAEAMAKNIPIPTESIGDGKLSDFFRNNYKLNTVSTLGKLNEFYVIDIDQTCDLVYHMWEVRYMLVHDVNNPKIERTATLAIAGNPTHIPPIYTETLNNHKEAYFTSFQMKRAGV